MWAPSQATLVQPWTILSRPGYFLSRPGAEGRKEGPCGLAQVSLAVELTMGALCGSGGRRPCGTAGPRAARPGLSWAGHSATGSPLRALSSEPQLPLGLLAQSPAPWRGEGLSWFCLGKKNKAWGEWEKGRGKQCLLLESGQRETRSSQRQHQRAV